MNGLSWLARVGPAPFDAWRCAMGWSTSVAGSHARRLERERWLARYPMTRGDGSLFVATPRGIRVLGLGLGAASAPAAMWWAHDCACAWTAAWLSVRGRDWLGPREVLADLELRGEIEWMTGSGWRRTGHRPDLAVRIPAGLVAVEVELQRKADKRFRAVLGLYGGWIAEGRIVGVMYVCGDDARVARTEEVARDAGLPRESFRTELLRTVRTQAQEQNR